MILILCEFLIENFMNFFYPINFNGLQVVLILCEFLIECHGVDIDFLIFKHNISKFHEF